MRYPALLTLPALLLIPAVAPAADVAVAPGASVQAAIDAADAGSVIRLAAGVYRERLTVAKPLTLAGAGWDRTVLESDPTFAGHTNAEKLDFATRLDAAADPRAQAELVRGYLARGAGPTLTVRSAAHVTVTGLTVRGAAGAAGHGVQSLVRFDAATDARLADCAVVGPADDGVDLAGGSDVDVRHCLVAAVWGTGVAVGGGRGQPTSVVRLSGSDVRNCYYAGVVLGGSDASSVDRCRISGAAWHGIRYDGASPKITGNLIFANARSGIYASGATHATVTGNVFWRNETDAVSCWFANADTIDRNTVVANGREGIAVLGDARPTVSNNVVADNPVGLACNAVSGGTHGGGDPHPSVTGNLLWHNATPQVRMGKPDPLPPGNAAGDPHFANGPAGDFAVPPGSPAGAADVLPLASPWPLQDAERAMIPDADTRDYRAWKKPAGVE